ncbi:MAG TPA: amidohydrolase [Actinomycetota bacterium]|nr:amidohydrolase [Actinomycetota bacterium]
MPGLAVIAHTVWGAAGPSLHDPRNRLGDALGRRLDLAVAVESGRITAVVPAAEVGSLGADRVVDLGDVTLMPGFVDAHVHLSATGLADQGAALREARSVAEVLDRVRAAAARSPDGLLWGDGYDETRFDVPELPTPAELADAAGGRPVYLSRVDGHQGLATLDVLGDSGALDAAGCDRDQAGEPTGVTRGEANHLARRHALAGLPADTLLAAQDAALCQAARRGVVCVHEMAGPDIAGRRDFELLLGRVEALPIEVIGYWGDLDLEYVADRKLAQVGGDLFLDGSLGSHTAALSTPYEDRPDSCGVLYHTDEELTELYTRASQAGIQVGVHAIGDVAIGQALRCARRAMKAVGPTAFMGCRHRIEHVELLGADGADRMAELGLAASVQPAFDAVWGGPDGMYARRLGPRRAKSMNPFADLWRRGVPTGGSSDACVTPLDPWHGVASAVHHHRPSQRLGLPVAMEVFTLGGRVLARQERVSGTIEPGQRADLTAFGGDVLAADPADLEGGEAIFTMVAGRLAHGPDELAVPAARSFGGWT